MCHAAAGRGIPHEYLNQLSDAQRWCVSLARSEMRDKDSLDEALDGDSGELLFVECEEMREESEKP
jgi:hypothetical protein